MPVPGGGALSGHTSAANIWDIPKRNEAFNGNIHLEMWDVRLPYLILLHGVCIYIYIIICIYFMVLWLRAQIGRWSMHICAYIPIC